MMLEHLENEELLAFAGRDEGSDLQLLPARHRDHLRRIVEIPMDQFVTMRHLRALGRVLGLMNHDAGDEGR